MSGWAVDCRAVDIFQLLGSRLARLHARQVPKEIVAKTYTFGSPSLRAQLYEFFNRGDPKGQFRRRVQMSQIRARAMIRTGFGSATHVYSMLSEGGEFLSEAHRRGLKVVSEIYILLATERVMLAERRAFPGWEPEAPDYASLRRQFLDGGRYYDADSLIHLPVRGCA